MAKSSVLLTLAAVGSIVAACQLGAQQPGFDIPKAWDDAAVAGLELPLAHAAASPRYVPADYYYRMRVRTIYRSYPVYAPGREPAGYFEWLQQRDPEVVFNSDTLRTTQDWINAGELVFDAPISYERIYRTAQVRDVEWHRRTGIKAVADGTVPYLRYVIRQKGSVELGNLACANCHTRVLPDGRVVKGAQGNFPFARILAFNLRVVPSSIARQVIEASFAAPWRTQDVVGRLHEMEPGDAITAMESIPDGVQPRNGTSFVHPVQVPDLIGIKDRKYLDHTGLQLHRDITDLMRYAAINQGLDTMARFGDFIPGGKLPDPETRERYSDEQLYALGLYLYSLQPPSNSNRRDALAQRGEKLFEAQECGTCHAPPLYTNNKLVAVPGFVVPAEHKSRYDILPVVVKTDPGLALSTRRGTGYYKIPSLRGVWYRGPLEHSGSVGTLEDWFDPSRLQDNYVPTGFRGYGVNHRAVPGHEFGLKLSAEDRRALIAFLKTL